MGEHVDAQARAAKVIRQQLESLERSGVQLIRQATLPPIDVPNYVDAATDEGTQTMATKEDKRRLLAEIKTEVAACVACQALAESRTQTVYGVGNPDARLCFFGEAPGADEDRQGEPFVGRAGQLLTDIIQKGMGLERSDVYILNTLKCRPPGNRNPATDEVANCRHFFERQLELIQPEFICCLGAVAAQTLLETNVTIGKLRGAWHDFRGMQVLCTYHPAYLLRNPAAKKETWKDIQLLMGAMGIS
jgi:DNA polymerase